MVLLATFWIAVAFVRSRMPLEYGLLALPIVIPLVTPAPDPVSFNTPPFRFVVPSPRVPPPSKVLAVVLAKVPVTEKVLPTAVVVPADNVSVPEFQLNVPVWYLPLAVRLVDELRLVVPNVCPAARLVLYVCAVPLKFMVALAAESAPEAEPHVKLPPRFTVLAPSDNVVV